MINNKNLIFIISVLLLTITNNNKNVDATSNPSVSVVSGSPFTSTIESPSDLSFTSLLSTNKIFLGVSNLHVGQSGTVSIFELNTSSGSLTLIGATTVSGGIDSQPYGISFTTELLSNGKVFLAVANSVPKTIDIFELNKSTGALTMVTGSPFSTSGTQYSFMAYAKFTSELSTGKLFLAAAQVFDNTIDIFELNKNTGALTLIETFTVGNMPFNLAWTLETNNVFISVSNFLDNTVTIAKLDTTYGTLTLIDNYATGNYPAQVAFTKTVSNNKCFLGVTNNGDNTISIYELNKSTGVLTSKSTTSTGSTYGPYGIDISNSTSNDNIYLTISNYGDINYYSSFGTTISVFQLNVDDGSLTAFSDNPFTAQYPPYAVGFTPFVNNNLFVGVSIYYDSAHNNGIYMYKFINLL